LFRLRNGIHLRLGGIVLVRRGSGAAADAIRWRRLPVPRLLAEDGGKQSTILIVRRRHCEEPTGPAFGGPDDKLRDEAIQFFCGYT
jgi:hypothetical protein